MRKRIYSRLLGSMAVVLGIAVCMVAIRDLRPQTARLPDGTILRLEAWDYGTEHRLMRPGSRWWQRLLPARCLCRFHTDEKLLVLWLRKQPAAGASAPPQSGAWWDWAEIVDEQGRGLRASNRAARADGVVDSVESISPTDRPRAYMFPSANPLGYDGDCLLLHALPRRGGRIRIRFYRFQSASPIAQFTLPNPAAGTYPQWQPESLPITKRDGDLAFTLNAVKNEICVDTAGADPAHPYDPARPIRVNEYPMLTTEFGVTEHGMPTRDWQPRRMTIADASGNRMDLPAVFSPYGLAAAHVAPEAKVVARPCTGEAAHRLHVEFVRSPFAHFTPEELWSIRDVAVPTRGGLTASTAKWSRDGVTVEFLGLADKDHPYRPMGDWLEVAYAHTVNLRITPPHSDVQVYLHATDDRGRPLKYMETILSGVDYLWQPDDSWRMHSDRSDTGTAVEQSTLYNASSPAVDNTLSYNLKIPPGVRKVNLTFAVTKSRWIDFTPRLLRP